MRFCRPQERDLACLDCKSVLVALVQEARLPVMTASPPRSASVPPLVSAYPSSNGQGQVTAVKAARPLAPSTGQFRQDLHLVFEGLRFVLKATASTLL